MNEAAVNFGIRGYRVWQKCAGTGPGDAATFAALIAAFQADLATQTQFCLCPDDQLVIYVAAHGYGGTSNPTGDVAMHFNPAAGTEEWITWPALLEALAPLITNPAKTYLLVYSCRSGRAWEPGVAPGSLRGLHLITATADSKTLAPYPDFGRAIADAIGQDRAVDWDHFVKLLKWHAANWNLPPGGAGQTPYGVPRNGGTGCRFKLTLSKVTYAGANLGSQWKYEVISGGRLTVIPAHTLANGASEVRSEVLYDRLREPCPSPPFTQTISVAASEVSVATAQSGTGQLTITQSCNGASKVYSLVVNVNGAQLTFDFSVNTTC